MSVGEPEQLAPGLNDTAVANIVKAWKQQEDLVAFAARGYMCQIGKATDIDRKEVNANWKVLSPVVQHLGCLAHNRIHPPRPRRYSTRNRGPARGVRALLASLPSPWEEASPLSSAQDLSVWWRITHALRCGDQI